MQRKLNRRLLVRLLDQNGIAELNRNNAQKLFYLARKKCSKISLFDKYLEKPYSVRLCGTNIYNRYYSLCIQNIYLESCTKFKLTRQVLLVWCFLKKKTRETIRRFMFYIAGYYCPEFNIKGSSIQPHYDTNCSINIPACPFRYNSQDVYKCMFYLYTFCIRINCYLEDLLSLIVNLLINYF